MSPELQAALDKANEWMRTATLEQLEAMWKAQRESWVRAFAPCEHGDPDWETCPGCLQDAADRRAMITANQPQSQGGATS
ncbi:MAG: hypothetical protein E6Q77_03985 [Rhizobium sp.]|nr:MAG: hypothetical protein E6Q77_03985 [Rhizobium sp.]